MIVVVRVRRRVKAAIVFVRVFVLEVVGWFVALFSMEVRRGDWYCGL